jgi:hypothetical protein
MKDARSITLALGGRWHGRYGTARCPVHNDREPSLKVKDDPRKADGLDVHCFAGCGWRDVKAALVGLGLLEAWDGNPIIVPRLSMVEISDEDQAKRQAIALRIWSVHTDHRHPWRDLLQGDSQIRSETAW